MINELTEAILLARQDRAQIARIATIAKSLTTLSDEEVDELVDRLLDFGDDLQTPNVVDEGLAMDRLIQPVINQLVVRETKRSEAGENTEWPTTRTDAVRSLYRVTPPQSDLRNHLLRWLGAANQEACLHVWADLICDDPPSHRLGIVLAFAPLMQAGFTPPEWLLEQLLQHGTAHTQIAPAVYDLFNFYFRSGVVDVHPATPRMEALSGLLGQLAMQLGSVEEGKLPPNANAAQVNTLVSDSVSLIVALCDTFALLKYEHATGKLLQAMELRHRRVQTEAAAALARMGNEQGKKTLIGLAEQPVSRLRVLAYAEELGFKEEISLELQGEIAIAESHLAIWLSEPSQVGLAPSQIEFVESREMYWPGYEHPVQCYLFKYTYGAGEQVHSNIAICGPMTHAFVADIQHLEPDDIYAAFAGWQTVHNEIYQISLARAESTFPNDWRRLTGDLHAQGFDTAEPKMAASFFGELILIAEVSLDGKEGTAIVDANKTAWFSQGNPDAPIDWQMAYAIWRGHQMLTSFNESAEG